MIDIVNNIDLPWDFKAMSNNPNLTMEFINKYDIQKWAWSSISKNKNITTWGIVQENPSYPWNYNGLALNPNITWDIIKENLHLFSNLKIQN